MVSHTGAMLSMELHGGKVMSHIAWQGSIDQIQQLEIRREGGKQSAGENQWV